MISIEIPRHQNRVALFELAKDRARRRGARLTGCVASGNFSAPQYRVEGTYETRGDFLNLTITKKPFYITERAIKEKLAPFFQAEEAEKS